MGEVNASIGGGSLRCRKCGAPVVVGDRICPACHQVLRGPEGVFDAPKSQVLSSGALNRLDTVGGAPERGATSAANRPTLEVRWGRHIERIPMGDAEVILGSGPNAGLRVAAGFLAPAHARIMPEDEGVVIEALARHAMVSVAGVDCRRSPLRPGQPARVGDGAGNFVTVVLEGDKAPPEEAFRTVLPGVGQRFKIGRDQDCAIRLQHPLVRGAHATLGRDSDGKLWIKDRSTVSGTFVNGERASGTRILGLGDVIQIGPFSAQVSSNRLVEVDRGSAVDVSVDGAWIEVVEKGRRKPLLQQVKLRLDSASFTAVVGVSGAGKSTLLRLVSGQTAPSRGSVSYNGLDLARHRGAFLKLLGFVPQDDTIHADLKVEEGLDFQARLRLASDTSPAERKQRIDKVLSLVGLEEQANQLVHSLSGGQRKRAAIAGELINDPPILFLDEPTSGLDPGLDKRMTYLLRLLADQGRTVVMVTHSIANLDLCDQLVLVAPGGYVAYVGSPGEVTDYFGAESLSDVFLMLESPEKVEAVLGELGTLPNMGNDLSPPPKDAVLAQSGRVDGLPSPIAVGSLGWHRALIHQTLIYAGRYVKLLSRDRSALGYSLLQGIAVTLLVALVSPARMNAVTWSTPALILGSASVWFGMVNSVRELVKERPIWKRERMAGALLPAYLMSKIAVLGGLAALQAASMVVALDLSMGLPASHRLISPAVGLLVSLWLGNLAGIGSGLAVSAVAPSADRAMAVLPYLLVPQLVLSGALFNLHQFASLAYLIAGRSAVAAVGGVAGVLPDQALTRHLYPVTRTGLYIDWLVLVALVVASLAVTWRLMAAGRNAR